MGVHLRLTEELSIAVTISTCQDMIRMFRTIFNTFRLTPNIPIKFRVAGIENATETNDARRLLINNAANVDNPVIQNASPRNPGEAR